MQDVKRHPPTPLMGQVAPSRTPVPPPAHMQPPPPHGYAQPTAMPPYLQPPMPTPPQSGSMYTQQPPPQGPPAGQSYYRPPPPGMNPPPVSAPAPIQPEVSDQQRVSRVYVIHYRAAHSLTHLVCQDMIMQVLALTPDTINTLPPDQKATIMQLVSRVYVTRRCYSDSPCLPSSVISLWVVCQRHSIKLTSSS
jgi:hypothetical protein